MATLTEMVAAVVVHSSAAAFSHFGVTIDTPKVEQHVPAVTADQRTIARSPRQAQRVDKVMKVYNCPETQARASAVKA
jgi:hypothetical protein